MSPQGIEVIPHPSTAAPNAIWVDDCKPAPADCAVAQSYDAALRMMRKYRYMVLYLDYDLGTEDADKTGLDLLRQLRAEGICPAEVICISWNPVGRQRIEAELRGAGVGEPERTKP